MIDQKKYDDGTGQRSFYLEKKGGEGEEGEKEYLRHFSPSLMRILLSLSKGKKRKKEKKKGKRKKSERR